MNRTYFISGIISFSTSFFMFFVLILYLNLPLEINIIDENGFESNRIPMKFSMFIFPSLLALSGLLFTVLALKKEDS